jgi:hypothetical protein
MATSGQVKSRVGDPRSLTCHRRGIEEGARARAGLSNFMASRRAACRAVALVLPFFVLDSACPAFFVADASLRVPICGQEKLIAVAHLAALVAEVRPPAVVKFGEV